MSNSNGNGKPGTNGNGQAQSDDPPIKGFRDRTMEKEWAQPFIESLREHANVSHSCRLAGVSQSTVYHDRSVDKDFATAWDEALEEGIAKLEIEVRRRALHGVLENEGKKYSDVLAMFLLKAHRPNVYRENINVNTHHTGEIEFNFQGMTQMQARKSVLEQIAGLTTEG